MCVETELDWVPAEEVSPNSLVWTPQGHCDKKNKRKYTLKRTSEM